MAYLINVNEIIHKIKENQKPLMLNFSEYELENTDMNAILDTLKEENKVISLNFGNQTFTEETSKKLGEILEKTTSLQNLDLSDCLIHLNHEDSFVLGLKENKTLQRLTFKNTRLEDKSLWGPLPRIIEALAESKTLISLNCKGQGEIFTSPLDADAGIERLIISGFIDDIVKALQSPECCIEEFYLEGVDSMPEVKAALQVNAEKSKPPILMEGIEMEAEPGAVLIEIEADTRVFAEIKSIPLSQSIFGKKASSRCSSSAEEMEETDKKQYEPRSSNPSK